MKNVRLRSHPFASRRVRRLRVIVLVHLRLRALPRSDVTYALEGARDDLCRVGSDVITAGIAPAALELLSPTLARRERWTLAVRLAGSAALVSGEEHALRSATGGVFSPLRAEEAHAFWTHARRDCHRADRVPARRAGRFDRRAARPAAAPLGDERVSASPGLGAVRWAGEAAPDRLRWLRRALAGLEVPLTLERAPWAVRAAVGHFGAYREGVGPLVAGLRQTFDPNAQLVVALEGTRVTAERAGSRRSTVACTADSAPGVPHLPRHRRRSGRTARPHRADARPGARHAHRRRSHAHHAPRPLPRLPRL